MRIPAQYLGALRDEQPARPPPPPEEDTPPIQGPPAPQSYLSQLAQYAPSGQDAMDLLDAYGMAMPVLGMIKNPKVVEQADGLYGILDEAGKPVGQATAWLSKKSGIPKLVVHFLGLGEEAGELAQPRSQMGQWKGKVGYTGMRNIVRQLFDYFPEAQNVRYERATGASANTAAAAKDYPIPGRLMSAPMDAADEATKLKK